MKESTVYQSIFKEGREEGTNFGKLSAARAILLRLGSKKLGSLDECAKQTIADATDASVVEDWIDRIDRSATWQELLAQ